MGNTVWGRNGLLRPLYSGLAMTRISYTREGGNELMCHAGGILRSSAIRLTVQNDIRLTPAGSGVNSEAAAFEDAFSEFEFPGKSAPIDVLSDFIVPAEAVKVVGQGHGIHSQQEVVEVDVVIGNTGEGSQLPPAEVIYERGDYFGQFVIVVDQVGAHFGAKFIEITVKEGDFVEDDVHFVEGIEGFGFLSGFGIDVISMGEVFEFLHRIHHSPEAAEHHGEFFSPIDDGFGEDAFLLIVFVFEVVSEFGRFHDDGFQPGGGFLPEVKDLVIVQKFHFTEYFFVPLLIMSDFLFKFIIEGGSLPIPGVFQKGDFIAVSGNFIIGIAVKHGDHDDEEEDDDSNDN